MVMCTGRSGWAAALWLLERTTLLPRADHYFQFPPSCQAQYLVPLDLVPGDH